MSEYAAREYPAADPVAEMRRRLDGLLAAGGSSAGPAEGADPGTSDPQRVYPDRAAPAEPDETVEQAKEAGLRLLAVRARSRAELTRRLADKGFPAPAIDSALDRLAEVGLIDDAAFAQQWVRERHSFSGKGRQALAQELRRKGVSREDADAALSTVTAGDETERATELVRRKLRTMPPDLDREKTIRRLVGMLARRGYHQSVAYTVVKAELDEARDLDSEPAIDD